MDEWEFVRYWFEDGGMDKVVSQYPEHFRDSDGLQTAYAIYKAAEDNVLRKLERLEQEKYGHEPD